MSKFDLVRREEHLYNEIEKKNIYRMQWAFIKYVNILETMKAMAVQGS